MIITLKPQIEKENISNLQEYFAKFGCTTSIVYGETFSTMSILGDTSKIDINSVSILKGVKSVKRIALPFKQVSRDFHPIDSVIDVGGIKVGGKEPLVIIGGPCSVECEEQIIDIAENVKKAGAHMLRGGAYKPRTSPYAFQGLGTQGILAMVKAREQTSLPIVSELMSADKIEEFEEHVDLIQIGARNMQNFELLKEVGKRTTKPILLKRGLANTIEEWLMSAEYIIANGNPNVILCERGIRTFEKYTRNTLDLSVVPIVKKLTHLPIIIDPSHATGQWDLVESMALASIAAGCDGLIIEVHNQPELAWSDGQQSLKYDNFEELIKKGREIAKVVGREVKNG